MRLFLLSSILALILSLQITNRLIPFYLYLISGLFISVWLGGLFYLSYVKGRGVAGTQSKKYLFSIVLLGVFSSVLMSFVYSHYWLEHRLQSRLPSEYSGNKISGVADVTKCDYSRFGVEKYELTLISISPNSAPFNKLRKISVSRYLNQNNNKTQLIETEQAEKQ